MNIIFHSSSHDVESLKIINDIFHKVCHINFNETLTIAHYLSEFMNCDQLFHSFMMSTEISAKKSLTTNYITLSSRNFISIS